MSKPGDRHSQEKSPDQAPEEGQPKSPAPDDQRSGRIAYDERGNSVWEWQLETGVYSRDISTQRLKKLDLNDLSIAETASYQRPPGLGRAKKPLPGGGSNPYDNSSTAGGNVGSSSPYNRGAGSSNKPDPEASVAPRKPMDLKKLEEWLEIKKRAEQNERGDDE